MLISRKHHFIFIHIYKTAGTSIREALTPWAANRVQRIGVRAMNKFNIPIPVRFNPQPCSTHATAMEVADYLGNDEFKRYFTFAVVRNPWDWQVSLYNYMLKRPDHFQHQLIKNLGNFDTYIRWRCREEVRFQKDFIYSPSGDLLVDFVARFENLDSDFQSICKRIGISARLQKTNVSNTTPYRDYYTDETREMVREAFAKDILLFGYDF